MKSDSFTHEKINSFKEHHPKIRYMEKKIKVHHGGFSQIESTILLLNLSYNDNEHDYDYFHLISGQDYPIISESGFNDLFNDNTRSYMMYDTDEEIRCWRKNKYLHRTQVFHFTDSCHFDFLAPKLNYYFSRAVTKFLRLIPYKRKVIKDLCGGWSWFSWHRQVVRYVLGEIKRNPSYLQRYRMTYCCDELIFHTMLNNKCDELHIERHNALRYIEWNPKRYTKYLPLVLDNREYIDLLKSGAIFARKFHPITSRGLIDSINDKKTK